LPAADGSERIEVSRAIAATPAEIFEILRDPAGHVAIDASGMLMGSTGDPVSAVGETFVMHMDRDALRDVPLGEYDVTVSFVTYVPDREIAWGIIPSMARWNGEAVGHVFGYRLEPVDGGTLVTQYCDWSSLQPDIKARGRFPVISEASLRATLGILARTVAPGKSRPGVEAG
jgi:hypothetical protein